MGSEGVENKAYVGGSVEMLANQQGDHHPNHQQNHHPSNNHHHQNHHHHHHNNNTNGNVPTKLELSTKAEDAGENEHVRQTWSNGVEFLMSCIAMSVGLGNIWRFPFTAYENGGGAFLIPYIIVLIVIGKPMYYMEMAMGQFSSRGSVKMWDVSPLLKGVGIGQMMGTVSVITYYTSLIALTLYYMFHSMASELPWDTCKPEWGPNCVDSKSKGDEFEKFQNSTFLNHTKSVSSSEKYFFTEVLKETNDISNGIGLPDLELSLFLLLAWAIIFLILVRGVKSSGKASYFLALFPYVVIITLLIKACTLDGAVDGIKFFLTPKWSELLSAKVWYKATTQLFFSLSVGMGTIVMFSSYNQFSHNIYRDVVIVTTLDTFTSLLGGMTIFAILGNLAHNLKIKDIGDVVASGTGLAFISYPDTISKFDVASQVFAVLFFFMLLTLGIGSVVALHGALTTVIHDSFPHIKFWKIALGGCVGCFFVGLIYVTPGGQWMLTLVDNFGGTFLIFTLSIVELIGVFWIYGLDNFCLDIEFMTSRKTSLYWRLCWAIFTPGLMILIFIYMIVNIEPLKYGHSYFPDSANAAGWAFFAIGLLQFPIWAIWLISRKTDKSIWDAITTGLQPHSSWGPKDKKLRNEWIKFKQETLDSRELIAQTRGHSKIKRFFYVLVGKY